MNAKNRKHWLKRALLWLGIIFVLLTTAACRQQEAVATVDTEIEAIEILSLLDDHQITAKKEETGEEGAKRWKVTVSAANLAASYRLLRDYGLPRPHQTGRETAQSDTLFPSPERAKQQRLHELETEIKRMLWLLPGVIRVKAIVSPADGDLLQFDPSQATASIIVVSREKEPAFSLDHIRELVAGSVAKLKPENVRVTIATELPRTKPAPVNAHRVSVHRTVILALTILILLLIGLILLHAIRQRRLRAAGETDDEAMALTEPNA